MFVNKKLINISFLALGLLIGGFYSPLAAQKMSDGYQGITQVVLDTSDEEVKALSVYVEKLNDNNFEETIANGVVIVDFYADWCGPCRRFAPVFEGVAEEMFGALTFGKLNVDEGQSASRKCNVSSIPTLILFKDGKEVNRRIGGCDAQTLKDFIQTAL